MSKTKKSLVEAIISKDFDLAKQLVKESISKGITEVLAESQLPPTDKQTVAANDTSSSDSPGGASADPANDGHVPGAGEGIPDDFMGGEGATPVEDAVQPQNDAVQDAEYNSKVGDVRGGPGKPWPLEG